MKPNQFAIALVSAVTITGGTLISSMGIAQACPLKGIFNFSSSPNTVKAIKIAAGTAVLGGSILGGLYLYRRQNQTSKVTDKVVKAELYKALEFPEQLPIKNK